MIKLVALLLLAALSSFAAGPIGYTFCANENQTCSFTGTMSVAYGANGLFNYKTLTGGTPCNNTMFGDPDVGIGKACYIKAASTASSSTTIRYLPAAFGNDDNGSPQPIVAGASYDLPMPFGCSKFLGWEMHTRGGIGSIDILYKGVSITGGLMPTVNTNTDAFVSGPLNWAATAAHLPLMFVVTSVSGGTTEANVEVACQQQ